jgi:PPOX class probable F420-dependent enzyme
LQYFKTAASAPSGRRIIPILAKSCIKQEEHFVRQKESFMPTFTDEQRAFLLYGTRTGKLATVHKDGRPHVVPIWFTLDGETLVFNTGEHSVKAANMSRDPRICLCVDDETAPYAYLMLEGTATWSTDPDALLYWSTRIGGRYMGEERAEEFGKRNGVPGELLVRVTPTRITFAKDIAS